MSNGFEKTVVVDVAGTSANLFSTPNNTTSSIFPAEAGAFPFQINGAGPSASQVNIPTTITTNGSLPANVAVDQNGNGVVTGQSVTSGPGPLLNSLVLTTFGSLTIDSNGNAQLTLNLGRAK